MCEWLWRHRTSSCKDREGLPDTERAISAAGLTARRSLSGDAYDPRDRAMTQDEIRAELVHDRSGRRRPRIHPDDDGVTPMGMACAMGTCLLRPMA